MKTGTRHLRSSLVALLITFSCVWQAAGQSSGNKQRMNIIFIVADDLGYGNLSSYNAGSRIRTPFIDKLAKEGTRFTRFYAGSPVCAPSRCALMTGYHMGHAYIRGNADQHLRPEDTTLAQRLQSRGYVTGMFGKWGLGEENDSGAPQYKGFDEFFGYLNQRHAHHYFTDHLFELKDKQLSQVQTDSQYSHDLIMDHALAFVREHKENPFFLYLPVTIPHAELLLPQKYLQPFLNADGSSKLGPETPFVQKNPKSYHSQAQPHAAFAAMITKLDADIGRLMQLLKELGLDNNTYVFFTSDNGPHKEGGADPDFFDSNGPLRGIKRDLYEGGIRVPMIVRAPGKVPAGRTSNQVWTFWDVLPTICGLTGTPAPDNIDGLSFVPAILGKKQEQQHDHLFWQFNEGQLKQAVIQGDWKLVRFKKKGTPEILELYNIAKDIGEQKDLAAQYPDKVKALKPLLQQSVSPAANAAFDWSDLQ
ncbi:arylsulfatase [uncultured Chitinophaga sp.]|jgi:Arylsulfatase A and related enzymes|uniref:arylsulfatase n=1 Tax=uncultured Chitinophaga sp. TaxID=339340 RepID=UPI002601B7DB|nr:arylsulfatase [uncultured Chitinophaga sp.]